MEASSGYARMTANRIRYGASSTYAGWLRRSVSPKVPRRCAARPIGTPIAVVCASCMSYLRAFVQAGIAGDALIEQILRLFLDGRELFVDVGVGADDPLLHGGEHIVNLGVRRRDARRARWDGQDGLLPSGFLLQVFGHGLADRVGRGEDVVVGQPEVLVHTPLQPLGVIAGEPEHEVDRLFGMGGGRGDAEGTTTAERDGRLSTCVFGRERSHTPVGLRIVVLQTEDGIRAAVERGALARDHELGDVVAGQLVSVHPLVL